MLGLQEIKTTEQRPHYRINTYNLQMEDKKPKGTANSNLTANTAHIKEYAKS